MRGDKFTKRALEEGYLARSIFKIKNIQNRFHIIRKGDYVLDLGAAPGSWSQYVLELGAKVDSIDLNRVKYGNWIKIDIFDEKLFEVLERDYNVVLSDLAPRTSGIKHLDVERSIGLSQRALEIAKLKLKRNGNFVCKVFQGEDFKLFFDDMKKNFQVVRSIRPMATRKSSREIYLIGLGKK
ncbi:RlmE family RNA methyltransferase [Candidatus Woesearchaeota archaeon]|nr:RlmE family RNA methyltransferase [Candidatus Woesearchaeota archaeon]